MSVLVRSPGRCMAPADALVLLEQLQASVCAGDDTVFRVWKVDGRKTEITEHKMENIVQIAQWLHLFDKTVFVLRADAEAYAKKEENQK